MHALQDLGEELLAMQPAKVRKLPIPPELLDALELAWTITSREGLRRQRQYIGKLMRHIDAGPIHAALDHDGSRHRAEVGVMHAAEHWRDRMLADPKVLDEFLRLHPPAEDAGDGIAADWSRHIEEARVEIGRSEPGRRYRELYRRLRDTLSAA